MGTSIVKLIYLLLFSLALCLPPIIAVAQDNEKSPVIESISVLVDDSAPEQVVFRLNGSYTPKTFRIDGDRPRLVLDFYGVDYPEGVKRISDVGGDIISGVRVGMHTDPFKTRVVVDIQKNTPYQYDYSFNVSNRSFVVTLIPDAEGSTAQEESAESPVHLGFEQLKVMHGSADAEEQAGDAAPVQAGADENTQQIDETNQAVVAIGADSMKKMGVSQPAEVKAQEAAAPEQAEEAGPAISAESAVSPTESQEQTPAPAKAEAQQTAEKVAEAQPAEVQPEGPPSAESQPEESPSAEPQPDESPSPEPPSEEPQPAESQTINPVLLDVSFEESINSSETVLFRLNHFSPPLVFGIEKGEPRVVCDFMGATLAADIPALIETNGQFVSRITVDRQTDPDKVRVELVLVPNRHYDLQQLFFKEDNLFVVIVKELQKEAGQAN